MAGAGAGAGAASHAEDVLKQLEDHAIPFITVPDDDDVAGSNAKFDVRACLPLRRCTCSCLTPAPFPPFLGAGEP